MSREVGLTIFETPMWRLGCAGARVEVDSQTGIDTWRDHGLMLQSRTTTLKTLALAPVTCSPMPRRQGLPRLER